MTMHQPIRPRIVSLCFHNLPHSSNPNPADNCLLPRVKALLKGCRFQSAEEVTETTIMLFPVTRKDIYESSAVVWLLLEMCSSRTELLQRQCSAKSIMMICQVHMGKVDAVLTAPHTDDIDSEKCVCTWFCIGSSNK
jgi:hypothetical protein